MLSRKKTIFEHKINNEKVINNIFCQKLFCVYGSSSWKREMEEKIIKHGGKITQSPDVKLLFAITGEKESSVLIQKAVSCKRYDVIQPAWIDNSIITGQELPIFPESYWSMKEETRACLHQNLFKFQS